MRLTSVGNCEEVAYREGRRVPLKKAAQNQAPSQLKALKPTLPNASSFGSNQPIDSIERANADHFIKGARHAVLAQPRLANALGQQCYGGNE